MLNKLLKGIQSHRIRMWGKNEKKEGLSNRQHLFVDFFYGMLLGLYIIFLFSSSVQLDTDLFSGTFKTLLVAYLTPFPYLQKPNCVQIFESGERTVFKKHKLICRR